MGGIWQRKVEGEVLLKDGGCKDWEVRKENLASCKEVVHIPTVKYIEFDG